MKHPEEARATRASAPWFTFDVAWWPTVVDMLDSLGKPWPEEMALADLRWWEDQVHVGRAKRIPGRRVLCQRWGWTDRATRALLREDHRWSDPSKASRSRPAPVPVASRSRPAPVPVSSREAAKNAGTASRPCPGRVPVASRPCPGRVHTRVDTQHTTTHTHNHRSSPIGEEGRPTATRRAPEQSGLFADQQQPDPPTDTSPPKKPRRDTAAEQATRGVAILRDARLKHHAEATGQLPKMTWGTPGTGAYKSLHAKTKRILKEIRAEYAQAEQPVDPIEALETLAEWAYRAPRAQWLRERKKPILDMLGGEAATRMARVEEALQWRAGGSNVIPIQRAKGGGYSGPEYLLGVVDGADQEQPADFTLSEDGGSWG